MRHVCTLTFAPADDQSFKNVIWWHQAWNPNLLLNNNSERFVIYFSVESVLLKIPAVCKILMDKITISFAVSYPTST